MARPKKKGSTNSYLNLGLEPYEEEKFMACLKAKDLSARKVIRKLVRDWTRETAHQLKIRPDELI